MSKEDIKNNDIVFDAIISLRELIGYIVLSWPNSVIDQQDNEMFIYKTKETQLDYLANGETDENFKNMIQVSQGKGALTICVGDKTEPTIIELEKKLRFKECKLINVNKAS